MGYQEALEKAGAKVLAFEAFGSYQGTWLAIVERDGEIGIVEGSYGSCSGCDAFQSEFDYSSAPEEYNGKYYKNGRTWDEDDECTESEFREAVAAYDLRLAEFGASYLISLYDVSHYERKLQSLLAADWHDEDEAKYCQWAIDKMAEIE